MPFDLRYGHHRQIHFDPSAGTEFAQCQSPATALEDLETAVEDALAHPVDFPSLQQAILPGDKVVLALDEHVPQGPAIVRAVADLLIRWGSRAGDITVLLPAQSDPEISEDNANGLAIVRHHPDKRLDMAYLAATPAGEPLYLNRALCDADVVLPVSTVRMQARTARPKSSDGLYPVFSHTEAKSTRGRRRNGKPVHRVERPDVSWLLGVQCMVQVVPGPGDSVSAVLAGEPGSVRRRSRQLCEEAWSFSVPGRYGLVVAAIEGGRSQQTWEQLGRALAAATRAVEEDGAIAVCCDLADDPGPALQALAESEDRYETLTAARRGGLSDALVAAQLMRASQQATVYLLSQLADDLVESLGMAPVQDVAEIVRLASRHETCLLLGNAQHAAVLPRE